ncbi:unnamed protein product [Rotaria sordida]|uniref:RNase H type-1 domain-containing protein n=2 Tax=Rotaria sordida TaxID=392033 RepID=A0A815A0A1_9BILA|nr:unnamed protein product [Rotaria sordida]CAF1532078.1 unnamed protein product [Rotaria sordida]
MMYNNSTETGDITQTFVSSSILINNQSTTVTNANQIARQIESAYGFPAGSVRITNIVINGIRTNAGSGRRRRRERYRKKRQLSSCDQFISTRSFVQITMRITYPRRCGSSPSCKQRFVNDTQTLFNTYAPIEVPNLIQSTVLISSHNEIFNELFLFSTMESNTVSIQNIDHYVISTNEIAKINDQILPSIEQQELICYVDGSYSHRMQIGHSGFRASDGSSTVHSYFPQRPRRGSTESEVFAAGLAIQHAFENCYNTLIIYTDNSKVEQLLCRPKDKDSCDYPVFYQTLCQYQQQKKNNNIRVERIRGHPTCYEQNQSDIKREFAKIDRLVRKKNQRYIRRQRVKHSRYYPSYYSYNTFTYYRWEVYQCLVYF